MNNIIAVMPCYKSSKIAPSIAEDVIKFVDKLICVDDCCPEFTAKKIIDNKIDEFKQWLIQSDSEKLVKAYRGFVDDITHGAIIKTKKIDLSLAQFRFNFRSNYCI